MANHWNKELIKEAIFKFIEKNGRPPLSKEFKTENGLPSFSSVRRHYNCTVTELLYKLGIIESVEPNYKKTKWARAKIEKAIFKFIEKNGRPPYKKEFNSKNNLPNIKTIYYYYNSGITELYNKLGIQLNPKLASNKKWNKEKILELLRVYYKKNKHITAEICNKDPNLPSARIICNYFGTFNTALALITEKINKVNKIGEVEDWETEAKIINYTRYKKYFPTFKELMSNLNLSQRRIENVAGNLSGLQSVIENQLGKEFKKNPHISSGEIEVTDFIRKNTSVSVYNNYRGFFDENPNLEIDILLPDINLGVEFNGTYWHSVDKGSYSLLEKTVLASKYDLQLIHIYDFEWESKTRIIKSILLSKLRKTKKIYARQCIAKEISNIEANEFLQKTHRQGKLSNIYKSYGLYFENELVAVMTFSKARFNSNYNWELSRYSSSLNTSVLGGASKLLKLFEAEHSGTIVAYADIRFTNYNANDSLYPRLGFVYSHTTKPNYYYRKDKHLYSRYQCMKHKLPKILGDKFNKDLTEEENMLQAGFHKFYDCGNHVFIKTT